MKFCWSIVCFLGCRIKLGGLLNFWSLLSRHYWKLSWGSVGI